MRENIRLLDRFRDIIPGIPGENVTDSEEEVIMHIKEK